MPGEVGPYEAQWNLRPRIEALRAEAKSVHKDVATTFTERTTEIGIARDRAARDQYASEQAAKSADIQVGVERKAVAADEKEIAALEPRIAEAERRRDRAAADELREDAGKWAADRDAHAARARQAELDAAQLREDGAGHQRRVTELNVERADVVKQSTAVEKEVDKIDEQVQLLEQARLKYAEADLSDDVAKRSTLELEAEALVTKAGAIEVDRALIRTVVTDLPETTPGIDADPGPLPPGFDDGSGSGDTNDTDLMDPNDEDGTPGRSNDTDLMDPNDVSDAGTEDGSDDLALTLTGSDVGGEQAPGGQRVALAAAEAYQPTDPAEFEPINAAASGTDGVADTSEYDTPNYETPTYEPPTYEESFSDPVAATEDSYSSQSDFSSSSADTDSGYTEPSYETESFEV